MVQVLNFRQHFNLVKFIKKLILILLFILPISNSFAAMVTFNQRTTVADGGDFIGGIHFNTDGTKMFIMFSRDDTEEVVAIR